MLVGGGLPNVPSGASGVIVPSSTIRPRALGAPELTMMRCRGGNGSERAVPPLLSPPRQLSDSLAPSANGASMPCRLPNEAQELWPTLAALPFTALPC